MAAFSVVYLTSTLIFYHLGFGDVSLVYANIINLLSRIAFCLSFIGSFLRAREVTDVMVWKDVVPRPGIFLALVISKLLIECSARVLKISAIVETQGNLSLRNTTLAIYFVLGGLLGALSTSRWWILSGQFATFRYKKE
jgi:oligosaccharide translocation protein RFT1